MKAVVQTTVGDPSTLLVAEGVELPYPMGREILIRVQAAALNRLDLYQAKGSPPPPGTSAILGIEVCGTVIERGADCVLDFVVGEAVMALLSGGGYAEFCVADERTVFRAIPSLSFPQLAAIPEAFLTAYQLCFFVAKLEAGDSVLLHAAASSVGQAAIQMLVRKGIKVFATSRSEAKLEVCRALGAHAFLPSQPIDGGGSGGGGKAQIKFAEAVKRANGGVGVTAVLCPVGADYVTENLEVLAPEVGMLNIAQNCSILLIASKFNIKKMLHPINSSHPKNK